MEKGNLYHFIYKTTNLKNGKFYIGMHSTNNLDDSYLGSGKHLRNSVYYHGKENFKREILEFLPDRNHLKVREKEIVNINLIKEEKCMNIKEGGDGGGGIWNETHLINLRIGSSNFLKNKWKDPDYRKHISEISGINMKEYHKQGKIKYNTFTGKHHSDETKKVIGDKSSVNQKGERNSQFGTCWITNKIENKRIKKEDITLYENNGWVIGRSPINNVGNNQYNIVC